MTRRVDKFQKLAMTSVSNLSEELMKVPKLQFSWMNLLTLQTLHNFWLMSGIVVITVAMKIFYFVGPHLDVQLEKQFFKK